jgi:hypothetical protein
MARESDGAAFLLFFRRWQTIIVLLIGALWTLGTGLASGYFTYYQFVTKHADDERQAAQTQANLLQTRADTENIAAETRKRESQRPFLQKQLDIYLETIQVAEKLVDIDVMPKTAAWDANARRFWQLRWGELEMVGDAGLRQAARRVGEQLIEVESDPSKPRHDLRWMVECLADEVRLSLEHSWGYERNRLRETATHKLVSKLPSGCTSGDLKPALLGGMKPLHAPGNQGAREPMEDN